MTHVLVTGAAGLLGGAVCRALEARGARFTALGHNVEPPFPSTRRADLTQPGALDGIDDVDAVVHAAAALPPSFEAGAEAAAVNRSIDGNVLLAAERFGARVVYASGAALYAPGSGAALDECAPLEPRGPYLAQKAESERRGAAWSARTGLPFTALRVSAPYGLGQRARTVIQVFIERAVAGDDLEYFGSGGREQDFTWADDAAQAFVRALEGPPGSYNVASGSPVSIRALAALVAEVAGLGDAAVRPAGRPDPQEGALARYDVTAARDRLGWTPSTTLRRGVESLLTERAR